MSNSMKISAKLEWDKKTKQKLDNFPSKVMYAIASQTLSKTIPIIPMDKAVLRKTTQSYGVRKSSELGYHLCSNTNYANSVYTMNDSKTNWSTPGTHSKWFDKTWDEQHESITNSCINEYKI